MNTALPDQHTATLTSADKINAAIENKSRTKKWTAERSGIPVSTFIRKLSGHTDFTVGDLARIAQALEVDAGTLLPDGFSNAGRLASTAA